MEAVVITMATTGQRIGAAPRGERSVEKAGGSVTGGDADEAGRSVGASGVVGEAMGEWHVCRGAPHLLVPFFSLRLLGPVARGARGWQLLLHP